MIRRALSFWLLLAAPLFAAPVTVTSGEHDGFTRLVFDFGHPVDWQAGRSPDGYELRLAGETPAYDLRQAFALIGRSRLAALWVDPASGGLHVGLACACHAQPFEFRPGIVVIDLKDGPPPAGSAFEQALDGSVAAPLAARPIPRPRPRPADAMATYDWKAVALGDRLPAPAQAPPDAAPLNRPSVLPPDPTLAPLRETLLYQMARGAAQGVVEMANPSAHGPPLAESGAALAQIRIGEAPAALSPTSTTNGDLTARGEACSPAAALNLAAWGDESRPLLGQMADATAGLTGEFDLPDPEALSRAIRFQLFLGFGAEARQLMAAFPDSAAERPLWTALSYLVEGEADPGNHFVAMAACDGPAALWAMLSPTENATTGMVNARAVRLAFMALPLHLRRHLGPQLAERFLARGDADTARALHSALTRAPGEAGDKATLLDAALDLNHGDLAEAEEKIGTVLADPGPDQTAALIALTEARVVQGLPLAPDIAAELAAHAAEAGGGTGRLAKAVLLAKAASGDFTGAFAELPATPEVAAELWALTAALAPDGDFLAQAVLQSDGLPPRIPAETVLAVARRLLGLGLAEPANHWLASVKDVDPILRARIALGRHDGREALVALAGLNGAEAEALTLQALELVGQEDRRALLLTDQKQPDAASLALARAGNWPQLALAGAEPWKSLAAELAVSAPPPAVTTDTAAQSPGPLARGHQLTTAAEATRAAVEGLLAAVPLPKTP